jgi:GrpB-like predicted nucleotidyltransferase (UPF0157 family)
MQTKDELGKLYPIILNDYDSNWPSIFEKEKSLLKKIFPQTLRIEHVGSTAIVGLVAKPTIDILIEKPKDMNDDEIIKTMEINGYIHMEEQTQHLMFVKGYTPSGLEKESFHIHMGPLTQDWVWDRVYFRDYLNNNREEAQRYEKLKIDLAKKFKNDREAYTEGKDKYIKEITAKAKSQ